MFHDELAEREGKEREGERNSMHESCITTQSSIEEFEVINKPEFKMLYENIPKSFYIYYCE